MPLTGTFQRSLDEKQRLSLPKSFRDGLLPGESTCLYVAPETDQSLSLFSADTFARRAKRLVEDPAFQGRAKNYIRLFYSQAEQVEPDSQGRIRLPERLIQFAGMKQEVVLLGVNDHVELWDAARWNEFLSQHGPDFDQLVGDAFA